MAKISKVPNLKIIRKFRGILDFYEWKGIPCVRGWPIKSGIITAGMRKRNVVFTTAVHEYNKLSDQERLYWRTQVWKPGISGRDVFLKNYLKSHP